MCDEYAVGDEDGLTPPLNLIREAIAREMYAQLPLRDNVIVQADIPGVAYAVAVMLDRLSVVSGPRAFAGPRTDQR